jgi:hypothetical protein
MLEAKRLRHDILAAKRCLVARRPATGVRFSPQPILQRRPGAR